MFKYSPFYKDTDSVKVKDEEHSKFDMQTFYEQIFEMFELVHTTTLPSGAVIQLFTAGNVEFLVSIDMHEHKVKRIDISNL